MIAAVAVALALASTAVSAEPASTTPSPPSSPAPTSSTSSPCQGRASECARHGGVQAPAPSSTRDDAPGVVAGASVAGFVGGSLFALPAVLAILPSAGPFVALPIGLLLVGGGAAFGGFLGELSYARLGGAGLAGACAAGGALAGALAGGFGAAGLEATRAKDVGAGGVVFFGLAGAALGGVAGAAAGGAAGALWVTPEER